MRRPRGEDGGLRCDIRRRKDQALLRLDRRLAHRWLTPPATNDASPTFLVLSPVLGLAFTVAMATGEVRYRIPFDGFFIVVACALVTRELDAKRTSQSLASN